MRAPRQLLARERGDLTPMIDVVFLLLVFFVCTLQFRVLAGKLESELPRDVGVNAADVELQKLLEPLRLDLERDDGRALGFTVRIDGTAPVDLATLPGRVERAVRREPALRALVRAGDGVTYGQVVTVVDACLKGGLERVTFSARTP